MKSTSCKVSGTIVGAGARPSSAPTPLAANARKRRVQLLGGTGEGREGQRFLSEPYLRLTLIAPDIIEAILTGRQPSTLQLDDLLKPLPAAWSQQRSALYYSK